jgi:hypothetical protein
MDVDESPPTMERNASTAARDPRLRHLYFVSIRRRDAGAPYSLAAINCAVRELHAEVDVRCPAGGRDSCRAARIRRSLADARAAARTPLDDSLRVHVIVKHLPTIEDTLATRSTHVERFLYDSSKRPPWSSSAPFVDLSRVPPREFSERLQLLLNTWYTFRLAANPDVFYGVNDGNISAYGFDFAQLPADGRVAQSVVEESCRLMCTPSTQATLTHTVEVFTYNRRWMALLFLSSAVLLVTGLAGAAIGLRTHVPDMLGYVSSMTYNNRYLPLPNGGGVLDAMDRARMLFDLPVSVSDVRGGEEVGRLAFTSHADVRMLEDGRMYT